MRALVRYFNITLQVFKKPSSLNIPDIPGPKLFVACLSKEAKSEGISLVSNLRQQGIAALLSSGDRSLKAQMRQANGLAVHYVAIIGEDEVKSHTVTLRTMATGDQQTVAVDKLKELLL